MIKNDIKKEKLSAQKINFSIKNYNKFNERCQIRWCDS